MMQCVSSHRKCDDAITCIYFTFLQVTRSKFTSGTEGDEMAQDGSTLRAVHDKVTIYMCMDCLFIRYWFSL